MNTATATIYSDLNGQIACPSHMGSAAEAMMSGKTPAKVRTNITVWERWTADDIAYWVDEMGSAPKCEQCDYISRKARR